MITQADIDQNFQDVAERIDRAARRAGRSPADVRLVTVTKTHSLETLQMVLAAGLKCFGESYTDEALEKIQALANQPGISWHMIGHVQSRKAEIIARHFDYLHSLDSLKLAGRLDRFAGLAGRRLPVLLECNTSGEANKYGYAAWEETEWSRLADEFARIAVLPNLEICGLMTVAPYADTPDESRPYFRKLAKLKEYLSLRLPAVKWGELSMGMSGDFEAAIEEGATWVRIGQSILGPRKTTPPEIEGV